MIRQQPDPHRVLIQMRGREAFDTVFDDGSGDRERVDLIGLAGLALSAPRGAHPVRRDADHLFAGADQGLLKAP